MSIEKQFVTFTLTCPGAKAQRQVFFSLTSRAIWLSFFACLHFRKLLLFEGNLTNGQHLFTCASLALSIKRILEAARQPHWLAVSRLF
jgi:hypothetical protein